MSADAAALALRVHEWATQELCLNLSHGQRMPSPEDIRRILRGNARHHATIFFDLFFQPAVVSMACDLAFTFVITISHVLN